MPRCPRPGLDLALARCSSIRGPARLELQPLLHHMAVRQGTGALEELADRPQDRLALDLPMWMAQDWAGSYLPAREVQAAVVLGMMSEAMAQALDDPQSVVGPNGDELAEELSRLSAQAWSELKGGLRGGAGPEAPLELRGACAIARRLGRGRDEGTIVHLVEHLLNMRELVEELRALHVDVHRGRPNSIAQACMEALGLPQTSANPALLSLALLRSDAVAQRIEEARAELEAARLLARELGLPSVAGACDEQEQLLLDLSALLRGQEPARPLPAFFAPVVDLVGEVLKKSGAVLDADPQLREAWELHRHGLLGLPEVQARFFGPALVLELEQLAGRPVQGRAEQLLELALAQDHRYYDAPGLLPSDADSLALAWRMVPLAAEPERWRARLDSSRERLSAAVGPEGALPVWLPSGPLEVLVFGHRCAGVEANLLISAPTMELPEALLRTAAERWAERILELGTGAFQHYAPTLGLWLCVRAAVGLRDRQVLPAALQARLMARLEQLHQGEAGDWSARPQECALLVLSALVLGRPVQPRWLRCMTRAQRQDGRWESEPAYITPAARLDWCTWYQSQLLTTALCHLALLRSRRAEQASEAEGASVERYSKAA